MPARTAAPCPSASPKRRLREWSSVQVSTRSPSPARPMKVSRCAPSATPSRVISTRPRVISAMRVLAPKPSPSRQAGADGQHVLDRAAHLDAGDVGGGVGAEARRTTGRVPACRRSRSSLEAMVIAVGRPAPTSVANVGPDSTATERPGPSTACATSFGSRPRALLETLGGPAQPHRRRQQRLQLLQQRAKAVAGHRQQHVVDAVDRGRKVRHQMQTVGKRRAGQVALIACARAP